MKQYQPRFPRRYETLGIPWYACDTRCDENASTTRMHWTWTRQKSAERQKNARSYGFSSKASSWFEGKIRFTSLLQIFILTSAQSAYALQVLRINTKYNVMYVQGRGIPGDTNSFLHIYDTNVTHK